MGWEDVEDFFGRGGGWGQGAQGAEDGEGCGAVGQHVCQARGEGRRCVGLAVAQSAGANGSVEQLSSADPGR